MERFELRISRAGEAVQVAVAGQPARTFSWSIGQLVELARALASCAGPLTPALQEAGARLFTELLGHGAARLLERVASWRAGPPVALVWIELEEARLHEVPWELMAHPRVPGETLGASPAVAVVRAAARRGDVTPRALEGPLRVLPVIPDAAAATRFEASMEEPQERGEALLEPVITREQAGGAERFLASLRGRVGPHVLHYTGTGSARGRPRVQLAERHGRPSWIDVEQIAAALGSTRFREALRLVVLDTRERALASDFASAAAASLAEYGVDATLAYLWRVEHGHAERLCETLYARLCAAAPPWRVDVASALAHARASLKDSAAAAYAPVLYLRGPQTALFERDPATPARGGVIAAQPSRLLAGPCSLILGDRGVAEARGYPRVMERLIHALNQDEVARAELGGTLGMQKRPLPALAQRFLLRFGGEALRKLLATVAYEASSHAGGPVPIVIDAVALALRPGLHVSLHWLPDLERALAQHNPEREIISVLPGRVGDELTPRVARRPAGASGWVEDPALQRLDAVVAATTEAFVVLRPLGGGSPLPSSPPSRTILCEDDFAIGPRWREDWAAALRGLLASRPSLFIGVAALDWDHRRILRWLFSGSPAPRGSVALVSDETGQCERDAWLQHSGGLGEGFHVELVARHESELVDVLAG